MASLHACRGSLALQLPFWLCTQSPQRVCNPLGFSQLRRCLSNFAFIILIVMDTTMFLLNLSGFSHLSLHLVVHNLCI